MSPGSLVLLRGHVDKARVDEFRKQGGEELVKSMAFKAMKLSKESARKVCEALIKKHPGINPKRVEIVGRGWEELARQIGGLNLRVEVQWFTLE